MKRRSFLCLLLGGYASGSFAHSPWGQYQVYRQKHLLVLSTREDPESYPFSKELVAALNIAVPSANARPARAVDLARVHNLLRTDQFQFALLSPENIAMLRQGSGQFQGKQKVDLRTIYEFDGLEFVVRADFPDNLVAVVTHGVLESLAMLPSATPVDRVRVNPYLHPGALQVLR
ncbi:MAG: hypothetical protein KTR18_06385 [Acidiferrobacterales bacterium]|nr:hypothetical protein [Acidiferrobacterales bacterium]